MNPLLVLGAGNQPHLVWTRDATAQPGCAVPGRARTTGPTTRRASTGRGSVERITKATGPTSLVLDTDTGAVHVLVNGNPNRQAAGASALRASAGRRLDVDDAPPEAGRGRRGHPA